MPRLNIRCCCRPEKILGMLDLPTTDRIQRLTTRSVVRPMVLKLNEDIHANTTANTTIEHHTIQLRIYNKEDGTEELSVYSDDKPVEYWKQFIGFIEI